MIYHITAATEWHQAKLQGFYTPAAFASEGFIHACKAEQVQGVRERYYKNLSGLLLLHIDEHRLTVPYEFVFVPASNDTFPHIAGPINTEAVVSVTALQDQDNGNSYQ